MIKLLNTKGFVWKTLAIVLLATVMVSARASAQAVGTIEDTMRADMLWIAEAYADYVWIATQDNREHDPDDRPTFGSNIHTPTAGKLEVGARAEDDWLHVWVQDNGPGIPPSDQERIFDKFTRLRGKGKGGGLGIGLAFCRLAVQGHGGRIWVESETDKGAGFHFTFPLATKDQLSRADD